MLKFAVDGFRKPVASYRQCIVKLIYKIISD